MDHFNAEAVLNGWKGEWRDLYEPIPISKLQINASEIKITHSAIVPNEPLVQLNDVRLADFGKGRRTAGVVSSIRPSNNNSGSSVSGSKKELSKSTTPDKIKSLASSSNASSVREPKTLININNSSSTSSSNSSNQSQKVKSTKSSRTASVISSQITSNSRSQSRPTSTVNSPYYPPLNYRPAYNLLYDDEENRPIIGPNKQKGPLVAAIDTLKDKSAADLRRYTSNNPNYINSAIKSPNSQQKQSQNLNQLNNPNYGYKPLVSFESKPTAYDFSEHRPIQPPNSYQSTIPKKFDGPILNSVNGRIVPPLAPKPTEEATVQ